MRRLLQQRRITGLWALASVAIALVVGFGAPQARAQGSTPPWMNPSLTPDQRADLLVPQMRLEEKVDLMTMPRGGAIGVDVSAYYNEPIPRLGIPALRTADIGPSIRFDSANTTGFPMNLAVAATWRPSLVNQLAPAVVTEARATRHNMLLGPNADIPRDPWWGRVGETFGEDPLLTSHMVAAWVRAAQARGDMGVNLKHFNLYSQETNSRAHPGSNALANERTIHEIYTPAWKAAVDEGLASAMCSFNKVNGDYSCENRHMLNDILRGQLGFKGFLLTDAGASHDTLRAINAGLDAESGVITAYGPALLAAVRDGRVSVGQIDQRVHNILRTYFATGVFDHPLPDSFQPIPVQEHGGLSREIEDEAITLLKNSNRALPLAARDLDSIAVIGGDADWIAQESGAGTNVNPPYTITPLDGLRRRAGGDVDVQWERGTDPAGPWSMLPGPATVPSSVLSPPSSPGQVGVHAEFFNNTAMSGAPTVTRTDPVAGFDLRTITRFASNPALQYPPPGAQAVRYTGTITPPITGDYTFSLSGFGDARLYFDGKLEASFTNQPQPRATSTRTMQLVGGRAYSIRVEYANTQQTERLPNGPFQLGWTHPDDALSPDMRAAVDLARRSDVAVVVTRPYEAEARDRAQLGLPNDQDQLIEAVSRVNPRTIVVLENAGPVTMPWLGQVEGVVQAYYGGQESGRAIADVLFGDVNPSGKLPLSYPRFESQPQQIGIRNPVLDSANLDIPHDEGVFVGYRGYERGNVPLQFPFGYGLSYTRFAYDDVDATVRDGNSVQVSFTLENTGQRTGAEVAQVYAGTLPTNVPTPPRQLAGYAKVDLEPGESKRVTVKLACTATSYYNSDAGVWVTPTGQLTVNVGSSVRDIRLTDTVTVHAGSACQGGGEPSSAQPALSGGKTGTPASPGTTGTPTEAGSTGKVQRLRVGRTATCRAAGAGRLLCSVAVKSAAGSSRPVALRLTKGGHTYAHGTAVMKVGKVRARLKIARALRAGSYRLRIGRGSKATVASVKIRASRATPRV